MKYLQEVPTYAEMRCYFIFRCDFISAYIMSTHGTSYPRMKSHMKCSLSANELLVCPRTKSDNCNTLQHPATPCNTLQHTATHCNTLRHLQTSNSCGHTRKVTTATHCNTLQHTATHCNTLQHTATHCNTLQMSHSCAHTHKK